MRRDIHRKNSSISQCPKGLKRLTSAFSCEGAAGRVNSDGYLPVQCYIRSAQMKEPQSST